MPSDQVPVFNTIAEEPVKEDTSPRVLTYVQAIAEALRSEMQRDENVLVLGEDVGGAFGGAFKVTRGLWEQFGERRVLNTPMSELGFTGMATGMAMMGLRPVIEMQFARFHFNSF